MTTAMEMQIAEREIVVEIARSWVGTPYIHMGRIKGAGCDCATLIAEVFHEAGLIPEIKLDYYSPQWHLHRDGEKYLEFIYAYAAEVATPQPGDVVLWRFGRAFSHGGIVVRWPTVIHAFVGHRVAVENADRAKWLSFIGETLAERGRPRPRKFLSYWAHGLSGNTVAGEH